MKKVIYGSLFLASICIGIMGCQKEFQPNGEEDDTAMQERLFLENLKAELEETKLTFQTTKSSVNPAFPANPFDAVGIKHNVDLEAIHSHPNFIKDPMVALQVFNQNHRDNTGMAIVTNSEGALQTITRYSSGVISNDQLNYDWMNSLNVSFVERQTLALYFTSVYSTDNINLRVALSKVIEVAVKNSFFYNGASKERLLSCFSIFRHSTVYWDDFDGYAGLNPYSAAVDALVAFGCVYMGEWNGFDIGCPGVAGGIAAVVSAVFDAAS